MLLIDAVPLFGACTPANLKKCTERPPLLNGNVHATDDARIVTG